jgi:hypothetical protein
MLGLVPVFVSTLLAQTTIPSGTGAPNTTPTTSADVAAQTAPALPPEEPQRRLHFGIEARADLWRHPIRPAIGVEVGAFDITLLTDPGMVLDGKSDVDLLFGWWVAPHAWQLVMGWRNSSIQIAEGRRYDETLILGVNAAMPLLSGKHLHATFGASIAADLVRHGGDIPIHTLPTSLADIADYVSFGFNARFEYALPF